MTKLEQKEADAAFDVALATANAKYAANAFAAYCAEVEKSKPLCKQPTKGEL
jgi:hypothetical protein